MGAAFAVPLAGRPLDAGPFGEGDALLAGFSQ